MLTKRPAACHHWFVPSRGGSGRRPALARALPATLRCGPRRARRRGARPSRPSRSSLARAAQATSQGNVIRKIGGHLPRSARKTKALAKSLSPQQIHGDIPGRPRRPGGTGPWDLNLTGSTAGHEAFRKRDAPVARHVEGFGEFETRHRCPLASPRTNRGPGMCPCSNTAARSATCRTTTLGSFRMPRVPSR
jgi:hypothetical protein